MQNSTQMILRAAVFVAAFIIALFVLGRYWNRPDPYVQNSHDHGNNLVHSHEHSHLGALGHEHDHPDMADVTHSHSHEHGHFHQAATTIEPDGKLFEMGHIHGDDVTVYWVDASQDGLEVRLKFYADTGGEIETIDLHTDQLEGEAFVELKSQGPVVFTKQRDQFIASLPANTPTFQSISIVVGEIEIGEESFNLKFQLPAD